MRIKSLLTILVCLGVPLIGADKKPLPPKKIVPASLGEELPFKWLEKESRLALAKSLLKFFNALDTMVPDPTPDEINWAMEESKALHKMLEIEEGVINLKNFSARMSYLNQKKEWNVVWFNMHVAMMKENAKKLAQTNLELEEELFNWGKLAHSLTGEANNIFKQSIIGLKATKVLQGNRIMAPFYSEKPHPLLIVNELNLLDLYGILQQMGNYINSDLILIHFAKRAKKYSEHHRFELSNVPEKFMTEKLKAQYEEAKKNSFKSSYVKMQELQDLWTSQKIPKPDSKVGPTTDGGLSEDQINQLVEGIKSETLSEERLRKILEPKKK